MKIIDFISKYCIVQIVKEFYGTGVIVSVFGGPHPMIRKQVSKHFIGTPTMDEVEAYIEEGFEKIHDDFEEEKIKKIIQEETDSM